MLCKLYSCIVPRFSFQFQFEFEFNFDFNFNFNFGCISFGFVNFTLC